MSLVSPDHRCPGNSRTCDQHHEDIPEFTWSIVAAGDLREERSEKTEKKAGSPQGLEEGNSEGITFPCHRGVSFFNNLSQSTSYLYYTYILCSVELCKGSIVHYFFENVFKVIVSFGMVRVPPPDCAIRQCKNLSLVAARQPKINQHDIIAKVLLKY